MVAAPQGGGLTPTSTITQQISEAETDHSIWEFKKRISTILLNNIYYYIIHII